MTLCQAFLVTSPLWYIYSSENPNCPCLPLYLLNTHKMCFSVSWLHDWRFGWCFLPVTSATCISDHPSSEIINSFFSNNFLLGWSTGWFKPSAMRSSCWDELADMQHDLLMSGYDLDFSWNFRVDIHRLNYLSYDTARHDKGVRIGVRIFSYFPWDVSYF